MKDYFKGVVDLFFPELCVHCNEKTSLENKISLCLRCELQLEDAFRLDFKNNYLLDKFKGLVKIEYGISQYYFAEEGVSQSLIHAAKYEGILPIFHYQAEVLSNKIIDSGWPDHHSPDIMVVVPNHWKKKLRLGYNQAEEYAKILSRKLDIPLNHKILRKRKGNISQAKSDKLSRIQNLKSSYELMNRVDLKGKHVLLVDDVITTGATIEICAQLLKIAGAEKISICSFMVVK